MNLVVKITVQIRKEIKLANDRRGILRWQLFRSLIEIYFFLFYPLSWEYLKKSWRKNESENEYKI